ncbi:MAG: sulfatase-like hydrolase/transferase, partial [Candidatus Hydrogenedentales bacterium]
MRYVACLITVLLAFAGSARPAERPNILFIYTDDQASWAVGAANPDFYTPNLDRLFAQGAVLSNAFVTTPVCSPSRAGLLASRYGTEVGITDWINPRGGEHQRKEIHVGLDPSLPTWVRQLRDAGYATTLVGKWHLGTEDRFHPTHFGYDRFIGFRAGGIKVESPELEVDGETRQTSGLTEDVLTDFALEVLRSANDNQPFLLSLHYRAPHAPWTPVADADNAPYAGKKLTLPEPDVPDLDVERVEKFMREYAASVTCVDRNVGRLLAALDELGLRDDTVVVFTSDNGYNIGHHGLLHKGNGGWITTDKRDIPFHDPRVTRPNMFDTSMRVPAAVRWPGKIAAGSTVDAVITNLDWYPTLLALAGLEPPVGATIH